MMPNPVAPQGIWALERHFTILALERGFKGAGTNINARFHTPLEVLTADCYGSSRNTSCRRTSCRVDRRSTCGKRSTNHRVVRYATVHTSSNRGRFEDAV